MMNYFESIFIQFESHHASYLLIGQLYFSFLRNWYMINYTPILATVDNRATLILQLLLSMQTTILIDYSLIVVIELFSFLYLHKSPNKISNMVYKRFQNGIQTVSKWYTNEKCKKNAKKIHKEKMYKILKKNCFLENVYKILKYDFESILSQF